MVSRSAPIRLHNQGHLCSCILIVLQVWASDYKRLLLELLCRNRHLERESPDEGEEKNFHSED